MGNVGKPSALQKLERSIWGLVMQVAHGVSVYDLLPVYMSAWATDLDGEDVSKCKSWLDDFGASGDYLSVCKLDRVDHFSSRERRRC